MTFWKRQNYRKIGCPGLRSGKGSLTKGLGVLNVGTHGTVLYLDYGGDNHKTTYVRQTAELYSKKGDLL